jgi:hypothetical protein
MTDRRAFLVRTTVALGSLALPLHALAQALPRVETALDERPASTPRPCSASCSTSTTSWCRP